LLDAHANHLFRTNNLTVGNEPCTLAKNCNRDGAEQREQYPVAQWKPGLLVAAAQLILQVCNRTRDDRSLRANICLIIGMFVRHRGLPSFGQCTTLCERAGLAREAEGNRTGNNIPAA
jgi:hypothetical protein